MVDESVLDLSAGITPIMNGNSNKSLVRNSSPFNGSDNDHSGVQVSTGPSNDFDSDLLNGEDGQGISQVKWTREKIAKLLDLYGKFRAKIEDPKYRKTEIWNKIAKALSDYDGITVIGKQCWDKFRYMKARYLRAREQKRRIAAGLLNGSETSMITFPYFNELQELLGDTPFEQEISSLKREPPADTFDNNDNEDYSEQADPPGLIHESVNNFEEIIANPFVNALCGSNNNRRKRKLQSDFEPVEMLHNNGNSSDALSNFMTAVIEMENRKLELFKRFVDLYEKRTSTAAVSSLSSSHASSAMHQLAQNHQSRFKRSLQHGLHGSSRPSSNVGAVKLQGSST